MRFFILAIPTILTLAVSPVLSEEPVLPPEAVALLPDTPLVP